MRHNGNSLSESPSSLTEPRRMRPSDAKTVAELLIAQQPISPNLANHLPALLAKLLSEETLTGACAEDIAIDGHTRKIAAVGLSGFLSDECVEAHLARRRRSLP